MNVTSSCGLTVSLVKTKGIKVGREPSFVNGVPVCDQLVEIVKQFPYLDSAISKDGKIDNNVKIRIVKAANVFVCLKNLNPSLVNIAMLNMLFTGQLYILATLLFMF